LESPVIGVLATYLSGPYNGAVLAAVTRAAASEGARVAAVQTAGPGHQFHDSATHELVGRVGWGRVAGLVAIANCVPVSYLEEFHRVTGKPVVAVGNQDDGFSCPVVLTDNRGGVRQAVEHLLGHGHTRIAFAGFLQQFDIRERYEAYLAALRDHGSEPSPDLFFDTGNHVEDGGRSAAQAMLAAGMPATAVVAATDRNAMGIMDELKEVGLVLPQKLAIVGFDDMPGCALQSPSLASVGQNFDALGTKAVEVILQLLRGEEPGSDQFVLPSSFVARESCGCVQLGSGARSRPAAPVEDPARAFLQSMALPAPADNDRAGAPVSGAPVSGAPVSGAPVSGAPVSGAPVTRAPVTRAPVTRAPLSGASSPALPGAHSVPASDLASGAKLDRLTDEFVAIFKYAQDLEPSPLQLLRLGQVASELYTLRPGQSTMDSVLALGEALSVPPDLGDERLSAAAADRLRECFVQVRLGVTKAIFGERNYAYYGLRKAMRDEYEITLDLLTHDADPTALGWLARTGVRQGLLALWRETDPGAAPREARALEVVGQFQAPGQQLQLPSKSYDVEMFPPLELFEAAGPECFVSLFPVRSIGTDWGFLAIADPMAAGFVGQDFVFMWSAIFSEALEHLALMRSLSERSEDLAHSYEREKAMAQAVRESEERYALAAQAANDGLWDWDVSRGTVYFSSRWKEMLGYEAADIGDRPGEWLDRVHPEDRETLAAELTAIRAGERSSLMNEHRVLAGDGTYKWALCRGLAVPGQGAPATRIVGSLTDVTERHLLEERLRHQALYDSLTGLPNRVLLMDRLSQAVATAKRRPGYSYTVLWLDLDNFKNLNDSLGHQFGDKLLVQVAERLRAQLRDTDTAARFGGDEFALLLIDVPEPAVDHIVGRLLNHLKQPYDLDGHEIVVSGSLGVATSTNGYDRAEDVLRDADIAMYRAKSTSRGTYATFDASMHASVMDRHETESELRQAVAGSGHAPQHESNKDATAPSPLAGTGDFHVTRLWPSLAPLAADTAAPGGAGTQGTVAPVEKPDGRLELHYQPVVDMKTGAVEGLEALVRWRHPMRGLVHPLQFLQVAEDSGLIAPIGRWVEAEACHQMAAWHARSVLAAGTRVSVNLSNREFWSPRFFEQLDSILQESGVRPELIALEITEGVIMDDIDMAVEMLKGLRARGLQVHVDDFGTGYSSLQSLHKLPIDALKIDKSFVAGLGLDDRTSDLVGTIVQLGRSIGVSVIAEGVATVQQHHFLVELECLLGQGYLFSPPLPANELEQFLAAGHIQFAGAGPQASRVAF
jgi:diguanylate cyclase (GGDEF)-like protein/PAS domain S-box-containing protein